MRSDVSTQSSTWKQLADNSSLERKSLAWSNFSQSTEWLFKHIETKVLTTNLSFGFCWSTITVQVNLTRENAPQSVSSWTTERRKHGDNVRTYVSMKSRRPAGRNNRCRPGCTRYLPLWKRNQRRPCSKWRCRRTRRSPSSRPTSPRRVGSASGWARSTTCMRSRYGCDRSPRVRIQPRRRRPNQHKRTVWG